MLIHFILVSKNLVKVSAFTPTMMCSHRLVNSSKTCLDVPYLFNITTVACVILSAEEANCQSLTCEVCKHWQQTPGLFWTQPSWLSVKPDHNEPGCDFPLQTCHPVGRGILIAGLAELFYFQLRCLHLNVRELVRNTTNRWVTAWMTQFHAQARNKQQKKENSFNSDVFFCHNHLFTCGKYFRGWLYLI